MNFTSKIFSTALLSLVFATASAQDWVEESNEHTNVVLKAQSQFQPEGATSLGLTEFDESVMDLGPDLFARTIAVDLELIEMTQEWLRTSENPETLIRDAQFGFQEIKSQMRSVARQIADQRGWDNGDLMYVMAELKKEQIPQDKILEIYKSRLAAIEEMIRKHDVITLPERNASIRLATEAESASIPAPFMSPPQLIGNTGQYGEFVLVQSNPALEGEDSKMDDWSHESVTWALTVHEARPGHEMQFAALVENGTSLARITYAFNSANVEGWGLYSEAIMMEYLPLEGQLFTLLARLQRAGRMFMDPMVNLGLLTPEDAVDFMINQIGLSKAMASSEADRYAFLAPGQATSYYYGYRNLERLRTEVEMALGERFNQRKYHDFLLKQGLLPPELLRQAVLQDFVPMQ